MIRCCRCNGNGRCRGCICPKNNRVCNNCKPGEDNRCENQTTVLPSLTQDGYLTVQGNQLNLNQHQDPVNIKTNQNIRLTAENENAVLESE